MSEFREIGKCLQIAGNIPAVVSLDVAGPIKTAADQMRQSLKQQSIMIWLLLVLVMLPLTSCVYVPAQPKENVWVTLANKTGQEAICLALNSPGNPFSTCLVGLPLDNWPCPLAAHLCNSTNPQNNVDQWDQIMPHFPPLAIEPQELEILGSILADDCLKFNWTSVFRGVGHNRSLPISVNSSLSIYRNDSVWCNYTTVNISISSNTPIRLPSGVFLICGDQAWAGIPSRMEGGPCTLGRLTLLTPNTSMILHRYQKHREKRFVHAFANDCDDKADFWSPVQTVFGSLVPGIGTAQALSTLRKMGCWFARQANTTSQALSDLLLDVDSIRHATLQNRAAIDFLLLAQGHGCDEFEGMCCMNLSDHSVSIHAQIKKLQELTTHLRIEEGWGIDGWLQSLGITGWLKNLVQMGLVILLVILAIMIILPYLMQCLQRMVMSMFEKHQVAMMALKENGESVESLFEEWLRPKGHDTVRLVKV